ncbi:MAG: nicotinate phosphoribosyltransferase [Acidobacteriota bacterium]
MERAIGLSTDLYQLTMAAAYFENGMVDERATFEMFVRSLKNRSYLIAAGLDQALDYLESLKFTDEQIEYLRSQPAFKNISREFFEYLKTFRFSGNVWALPEGTAFFANEPMLRVEAPIIEAQLVETFLLSTLNFQTMIASKTARLVTVAGKSGIIEFGTRRAHGTEAGMYAARAAYIAGAIGTSNVEAGFHFGIPIFGTLAHSFVMSFEKEDAAFHAFLKAFPESATILVDTYDTLDAVERLTRDFNEKIPAIRLDSGDLLDLSIRARKILNDAGMSNTKILASGDLNEDIIADLISKGATIDAFGVGTYLATSFDQPALGGIYKLVELEANGKISLKIKLSPEKATYPGAKQVWRLLDENEKYISDLITFADEQPAIEDGKHWQSLIVPVMHNGKATESRIATDEHRNLTDFTTARELQFARLQVIRKRAGANLQRLPEELLALYRQIHFDVQISERLQSEREMLKKKLQD